MNEFPIPGLTVEQYATLMRPLNATRVAKRSQGGKQLSYLESFDVRAHLIRIFGFGNFDAELLSSNLVFDREYKSGDKQMREVAYKVEFRLSIRDNKGYPLATYTEAAVGSASGGSGFGDLHDNALKSAASDALKRCAINLGTQFGLSLYDDGTTKEIVRDTLVKPDGAGAAAPKPLTPEQAKMLKDSLGATPVDETVKA